VSRTPKELAIHPVADLFPPLPPEDFAALVEDIRHRGVKVPILVHKGYIIDGRHRYMACRQLGKKCPSVEWNGQDPWLEAQSRNLLRRHLRKEQVYAIRLLAAARFPEVAASMASVREDAKKRKAQAKGQRRGVKALSRAHDRHRESADAIGAQIGVSGDTVKRVDRVVSLMPELLPKLAAGVLSANKAARLIPVVRKPRTGVNAAAPPTRPTFIVGAASRRFRALIRQEWAGWPSEHRSEFLRFLRLELRELVYAYSVAQRSRGAISEVEEIPSPLN
jgi:ParB-like chromosome segregation protein Spo0J